MDAAQASPVSAWMAVSREQNDHPLVPHEDHSDLPAGRQSCSQSLARSGRGR
jgi:hypothetical protein